MSRLGANRMKAINRPFYFYLVGSSENGPTKIGMSSNLNLRLLQLQTGNPEKLEFLYTQECGDCFLAETIESAVLNRFRNRALCGEWVSASKQEILEWLEQAGLTEL